EEQHHELAPQLQFPPGYHFVPTEQELLSYLRSKIEGQEQPLAVVNEVAILDWQPGSLVEAYKGYGENKWYFFTVREPSSSNKEEEPNRKVRVPGVKATWKATGSVAPIAAARAKQQDDGGKPAEEEEEEEKVIVGTKRVLIYQSSDAEEDGKWSMHEYILKGHAKVRTHIHICVPLTRTLFQSEHYLFAMDENIVST
uniref:NAC domain-containing protein n=1 Tax=Setaria italica TaxID=4555 RepID=K3ZDH6_SETIT